MKKQLLAKILFMALMFPLLSYAQEKKWPSSIFICGGSSTGSTAYLEGAALAKIINQYLPGITASPLTVQGAVGAQLRVLKGEVDIAYLTTSGGYDLIHPFDPVQQQKQFPLLYKEKGRIRQLYAASWGLQQVIARAGINSFADLKGKRFAYEAHGSFGKPQLWNAVFEYYKLNPKDIVSMLEPQGVGDEARLFKEGLVDATTKSSTPPVVAYTELFRDMAGKIHLLSLTNEAADYARKKVPFYKKRVIPAGTYPGQDKDVISMSYQEGFMTRVEMPEDFAYQLVKTYHQHLDEVKEFHVVFKRQFSLENSVSVLIMPVHPGAKRYYKEAGVWTEELERENKELLSALGVSK